MAKEYLKSFFTFSDTGGFINHLQKKFTKKYIRDKYDIEIAFVEGFSTKLIANSLNNDSKKIAWVHIDVNNNPYADNYYSSLKEHIEAYEKFDKILCVSQSVKDSVINKFNPKTPVEIQYNPVDSNTVVRLSEESIPISVNDDIQLVTIGRLENQKGYIRLIEQLNKLKCEGYAFSLWIIGEGSQRPVLESMIKDYNLDNNVKLLGFQTNPYKYVSKSDAFICSSYAEGFSTAATESLILGRPIITVDCAGMKELFSDKNCGIICDNTDEALYEMIKTVLDKPKLLDSFKDDVNVRKNDFNISVRIKEIEDIFESFAGV
jgi:glycosyltransferase involved in cell wall biosynthesis